MRPRLALLLAVPAVLFLAPVRAGAADAATRAKFAGREHMIVRIDNATLHPETVELAKNQVVGWINYSDYRAVVSFPDSATKALECVGDEEGKPVFAHVADRVETPEIGSLEMVVPCDFEPGRYPYEVRLYSGQGQEEDTRANPELVLHGTIVAE